MASYPTKLMEAFAAKALQIFYMKSVATEITNSEYEGEVRNRSSKLNVLTFGEITEKTYTGADLVADDLTESNSQLITDQAKAFYFTVKSYDTFRSYVKNPEATVQTQVANRLKKVIDTFVLGLYGDVGSGNWDGTVYDTGTVTITVTTGAVVGSGTTFTSSMVGKPFQADGHTDWYRVKSFASATSIVIEDDSDDDASAYTGGAIGGGSSYEVQANTATAVTKDTVFARVMKLHTLLSNAEIPDDNRWVAVPVEIASLIRQAPEYVGIGSEGGRASVQNGLLPAKFCGFNVYEVSDDRISGNSTDGYYVMAGHKSAICFAMGLTEAGTEDAIGNFGVRFKSLYVYGAKVADERRKALALGYWSV